jgi:hypothetical protein
MEHGKHKKPPKGMHKMDGMMKNSAMKGKGKKQGRKAKRGY